jgi:hypothetical protein
VVRANRNRKLVDSPLEEAVRSEPVSDVTPSGDRVLAIPFQDNSKAVIS